MLDNFIVNVLFLLARCEGGKRREQVFGGWVTLTFRIKDLGVELRTKCSVRGGNSGVTNVGL